MGVNKAELYESLMKAYRDISLDNVIDLLRGKTIFSERVIQQRRAAIDGIYNLSSHESNAIRIISLI